MDRARACGCVSNNFVQNQQRLKQRKDHLDRIKKIRNRKPGSSTTIDCKPPTLLHASAAEKRKAGRRVLYGLTVERENKALLQRMSAILTEPAKDTVKEYEEMKKLIIPKSAGQAGSYERYMVKKRNERFFEVLRNQKPFYSTKIWEKEYKEQKHQQRFMREVNYKRPPGFVDPFAAATPTADAQYESSEGSLTRKDRKDSSLWIRSIVNAIVMLSVSQSKKILTGNVAVNHPKHRSAAHIDRIRAFKENNASKSDNNYEEDFYDFENSNDPYSSSFEINVTSDDDFYQNDGDDDFEDEENDQFDGVEESRELLAEIRREIRVTEEIINTEDIDNDDDVGESCSKLIHFIANAEVQSWLVDNDLVVFSAAVAAKDGRNFFAEAEITLEDLASLRKQSLLHENNTNSMETEHMAALRHIKNEMIQWLELRIDPESGPRLVLNLVDDVAATYVPNPLNIPATSPPATATTNAIFDSVYNKTSSSNSSSSNNREGCIDYKERYDGSEQCKVVDESSHGRSVTAILEHDRFATDNDDNIMLIDDANAPLLTVGVKLDIQYEGNSLTSYHRLDQQLDTITTSNSISNKISVAHKKDSVHVLLKAKCNDEDQLIVVCNVMTNSCMKIKRSGNLSVVPKGTILSYVTLLPSVFQADIDLRYTFADNLFKHIKIINTNGINNLTITDTGI